MALDINGGEFRTYMCLMRIARERQVTQNEQTWRAPHLLSWTSRFGIAYSYGAPPGSSPEGHADVAQLVEHHLAKVRVAGSSPVIRSEERQSNCQSARWVGREARQRPAKPCTRVRIPYPPRNNGRLAQRERASLTRKRSLVRSQYRPPIK